MIVALIHLVVLELIIRFINRLRKSPRLVSTSMMMKIFKPFNKPRYAVLRVNFRGSDQLFFYQNLLIILFCILNVQHNLVDYFKILKHRFY